MAINIKNINTAVDQKKTDRRFSIQELMSKDIQVGSAFNDKKKEKFYSDLQTLFNAGMDLRAAFDLMLEDDLKPKDKEIITSIKERIIKGASFSDALKASGYFSPYEYFSVKIGEETGNLSSILSELAHYFQKRIALKRQLSKVFSYPIFVISLAIGVVYFMMKYIVPMFGTIFKRFGGELPGMTKNVIWMSDMVSSYSGYFFGSIILVVLLLYFQRKKEWFRKYSSFVLIRIPLFGPLIRKVYVARFCQSMQLLIASHTSLTEALEMVEQMISFYPLEIALKEMREDIIRGQALSKSMQKFPIFDKKMISLIKVAEEVNQMDVMFQKLSKQYGDEVDHKTATLGSIMEPALMLFVGTIVGFILIALYLPMFNLGNTIK